MIIAKAVEGAYSLGGILLLVVVNKGKALALPSHLVLGQKDAGYVAKRFEKFLKMYTNLQISYY